MSARRGILRVRRRTGARAAAVREPRRSVLTEAILDQLVGDLPFGIWLHDGDLVLRWANAASMADLGGRFGAVVDRFIGDFLPPAVVEMHRFVADGAWPAGFEYSSLWRSPDPGPPPRRFRIRTFPIRTVNGVAVATVTQDVTDEVAVVKDRMRLLRLEREARARADDAVRHALARAEELRETHALLRVQVELFRATAELSTSWVFVFDPSGRIIFVNDAACHWAGRPVESVLGGRLWDVFTPDVCRDLLERGERIFASGVPEAFIQRMEIDGGPSDDVVLTVGVAESEGGRIALIGVGRPIGDESLDRRATELADARVQAAQREVDAARREVATHEARAREVDASKDVVLALVSHDLRTPLTSVLGYAELLRADADALSERHARFVETIVRNCERLIGHLDDMMLVAQHQAGEVSIRREVVDLESLAAQCVATALPDAEAAGITITLDIPPGFHVIGDPVRLGQLLDNLVSNAVKYSFHGGYVLVDAALENGSALVRVCDNGRGIPVEEQARIFERFARARDAVSGGVKGFGLGLAIASAIVEAHGGEIGVESMLGTGSVFWFTLPVTTSEGHPDDG